MLVEPPQFALVFGGDNGQGALWAPFTSPPNIFSWAARLMTYEDVFQAGHVDFDYSLARVSVANDLHYHATRDYLSRGVSIEALGLRYDPVRNNCHAVVSTLVGRLGYSLPPLPILGWFPAYGRVILTEA